MKFWVEFTKSDGNKEIERKGFAVMEDVYNMFFSMAEIHNRETRHKRNK